MGARLIAFTSGRRRVLPTGTKQVSATASTARSAPAHAPTAAEHHKVAAVLRPQTFPSFFMMTPAPRNPPSGNHIRNDLSRPGVAIEVHPDVYKRGGSNGHQCVRSQPPSSSILPFGPDQGAEDERPRRVKPRPPLFLTSVSICWVPSQSRLNALSPHMLFHQPQGSLSGSWPPPRRLSPSNSPSNWRQRLRR
jgi:hypothetical protein